MVVADPRQDVGEVVAAAMARDEQRREVGRRLWNDAPSPQAEPGEADEVGERKPPGGGSRKAYHPT